MSRLMQWPSRFLRSLRSGSAYVPALPRLEALEPRVLMTTVQVGPQPDVNFGMQQIDVNTDRKLTFVQTDGSLFARGTGTYVVVELTGPGSMTWSAEADGLSLHLTGTTEESKLSIRARRGAAKIEDITVDGSIGSIIGRRADVQGDVNIEGSADYIRFRDLGSPYRWLRNPERPQSAIRVKAGDALRLRFRHGSDYSILAQNATIESIQATNWSDTDFNVNPDVIEAANSTIKMRYKFYSASHRRNPDPPLFEEYRYNDPRFSPLQQDIINAVIPTVLEGYDAPPDLDTFRFIIRPGIYGNDWEVMVSRNSSLMAGNFVVVYLSHTLEVLDVVGGA